MDKPTANDFRSHFTWSIESPIGECPFCGGKTVTVCHGGRWQPDEESVDESLGEGTYAERFCDGVRTNDELTAHYCDAGPQGMDESRLVALPRATSADLQN